MNYRNTPFRSLLVPMMRDALKGLTYVIDQRGLSDDPDFADHVGFATGVLDVLTTEMEAAPEFVPDEEIVAMYQSGLSLEDTAARVGCSTGKVQAALRREGVRARPRGRCGHSSRNRWMGMYPERTERMIALHNEGRTLEEIGAEFRLTRERVRQILNKAGVDTNTRPLTPEQREIVAEYVAGDSLWVVAERHQLGISTLKNLIIRGGYHIRPSPRMHTGDTRKKAERAAELYHAGMKVTDIAERLGYPSRADGGHGGMIYRLLAIAGVSPNRIARRTPKTKRIEKR